MALKKLCLATRNPNKIQEIQSLLKDFGVEVLAPDFPHVEETGTTFQENASLKARACFRHTGLPSLADDSGLCIPALGGAPGIFSKRWAGEGEDYKQAFSRIEEGLESQKKSDRSAYYLCTLAYCWDAGQGERTDIFEGRIDGHLIKEPRGSHTFGYDPIFIPMGHAHTFGEMGKEAKKKISHRTQALKKFLQFLS